MSRKRLLLKITLIGLSLLWSALGHSAPSDTSLFVEQNGGFVDLADGSYVQGSKPYGGIQPDYKIDLNDPDLAKFIKKVKINVALSYKIRLLQALGKEDEALVKKIELVTALVQKVLPLKQYDAQPYREILKEHHLKDMDISLGSYLSCGAGVCRENALLTHVTLKAVGVENKYVYAFVQQGTRSEDHAIVVVNYKNERWVVDPYNSNFHGRNFDDLLVENGKFSPRLAPFAQTNTNVARIVRVNNFPIYWIPKASFKNSCSNLFL